MSATIAIVDDDRDLGEIIYRRLKGAGYKCMFIPESLKAFPIIKKKRPDMAIVDVMMPKLCGYELCRQIRRDPLVFMTPVLMLSALGGEPEISHALQQGADDYLVKPFDSGTFFAKVKTLSETRERLAKLNPITGYHGLEYMKRLITNRLLRDEPVAVCHMSMMHLSPYTSVYGEAKRDEAVGLVGDLLRDVMQESGVYECAISHLGGGDFMVMLAAGDFQRYIEEVVSRFQVKRGELYSRSDLERGCISVPSSNGGADESPMMSLAVGTITTENIKFQDSTHIVRVAGEINRRARQNQVDDHMMILREGVLL
jgi:PleD family two-component response regulator